MRERPHLVVLTLTQLDVPGIADAYSKKGHGIIVDVRKTKTSYLLELRQFLVSWEVDVSGSLGNGSKSVRAVDGVNGV